MRLLLTIISLALACAGSRAAHLDGYVCLRNADSLTGRVVYHYAQRAVHLLAAGQVRSFGRADVVRFAFYDEGARRMRRFVRVDTLEPLVGQPGGPVFLEVVASTPRFSLLARQPFAFGGVPQHALAALAADARLGKAPANLSRTERRLLRLARRHTRRSLDAAPVYYCQTASALTPITHVRRLLGKALHRHSMADLISAAGADADRIKIWAHLHGDPFRNVKKLNAFCQALDGGSPTYVLE